VRCGPGNDHAYGEEGDRFDRSCEHVSHSNSPTYPVAVALALTRALGRSIHAAHEQICVLELLCLES
jgi:hypothetical protein